MGMDLDELKGQFDDAVKAVSDGLQGFDMDALKDVKLPASKEELLELTDEYDKKFDHIPFLSDLSEQTKLPKSIVVAVLTLTALLFTVVSFNVKFLGVFTTNLIGFAYPAYASIKAIDSPQKDDDTKWLTYWVVYSYFYIFEMLVLGPMGQVSAFARSYFVGKVLALCWCQFGGGASILYKLVVYPVTHSFFKVKERVEDYLSQFEEYRVVEPPKQKQAEDDDDDE
mmetsp:Transcript_3512/g.4011  ORF Transcript_3512/g.4011 Transcript_3512/m.4011 type:complete len:226 (+) Transcript_3512:320-997(+)|eukprot:CAMPEP_0184023708 /NCGR_PEP_ID=MMETSP0954-20121128/11543_1 /TAXON_ID=627963 /ORGANISM="Aplanochytrium sp, Strain PBS07" /LENGTH=225 /DNA_ID=CAMNT_0026306687 /DNA_START=312 /DNA_END=989 /DNA_ORIENTATION=-